MIFKRKNKQQRPRQYQERTSQKQQVFSYRSSRKGVERTFDRGKDSVESGKPSRFRSSSLVSKMQLAGVVIIVVAGLAYSVSLNTSPQIRIEGEQSFPREPSAYQDAITEELNSNPLNRNKLTLNTQAITDSLQDQFPEIQYVEVKTTPLRRKPIVNIQLAQPTARLVTPTGSFVLDGEGRALFDADKKAAELDLSSLIPISDNSGHQIEVGKPAVTQQQIAYIREVIGQFEKKSIPIKEMALGSGGVELQVKPADKNYFIKFSFYSDPRQSSGSYIAVREKGINANQYVDVRIPDKVFVK